MPLIVCLKPQTYFLLQMCAGRLELYKKNTNKIHARKRSFKEK